MTEKEKDAIRRACREAFPGYDADPFEPDIKKLRWYTTELLGVGDRWAEHGGEKEADTLESLTWIVGLAREAVALVLSGALDGLEKT